MPTTRDNLILPSNAAVNADNAQKILAAGCHTPIAFPVWTQWRITAADLTAAATTQSFALQTVFPEKALPDRICPLAAYVRLGEVFDGGALTAMAIDFGHGTVSGVGSDGDGWLDNVAVGQGETPATYTTVMSSRGDVLDGAPSPTLLFSATGGNVSLCTTGSLEVALLWCRLPAPLPAA